jgi:hypothetical protein
MSYVVQTAQEKMWKCEKCAKCGNGEFATVVQPTQEKMWKLKKMEHMEKIPDKISNISVNDNGMLIEQLKQIVVPQK